MRVCVGCYATSYIHTWRRCRIPNGYTNRSRNLKCCCPQRSLWQPFLGGAVDLRVYDFTYRISKYWYLSLRLRTCECVSIETLWVIYVFPASIILDMYLKDELTCTICVYMCMYICFVIEKSSNARYCSNDDPSRTQGSARKWQGQGMLGIGHLDGSFFFLLLK